MRPLAIAMLAAAAALGAQPAAPGSPPPAPHQPTERERFDARLEGIDAAMAKVGDLRADFEQRRHTPLLKKPLVSKGRVITKGETVRWDTSTPRASSMYIGGGEIKMYYPADRLLEVYPIGEGFKDIAGAPLPRLSMLRARFDLAPLGVKELGGDEKDQSLLAVTLTPRSEDLRKHVVSVKVLIDSRIPAATKVVMTDPEGERTEILFTGVRLNSGVTDDDISLKVPADARVSHPLGEKKSKDQNNPSPAATETKR